MPNSRISRSYGSFVSTSLMAQQLKNLPAMQETQAMVQLLGWEASLEELPDPGIKQFPMSPALQADFIAAEPSGKC